MVIVWIRFHLPKKFTILRIEVYCLQTVTFLFLKIFNLNVNYKLYFRNIKKYTKNLYKKKVKYYYTKQYLISKISKVVF